MASKAKARPRRPDEAKILALLEKLHAPPAWAFLRHVAPGTGAREYRWADAVAMSLWPSRGLEVHGFEVKSWRNDWLRELKQPEKAEEVAAYCDRWWVVAAEGVVQKAELPPLWGLLEVQGRKLVQVKQAPMQEAKVIDRDFLAAVLRRASEGQAEALAGMTPTDEIQDRLNEERAKGAQEADRWHKRLKESIDDFEKVTGIKLTDWNGRQVGEDFKRFLAFEESQENIESSIQRIRHVARHVLTKLGDVDTEIPEGEVSHG